MISGLSDPLGLARHRGRLYVSSVGRVDAYAGFTGTRFARRETVLRGPLAHGENNDLVLDSGGRFVMGITATCDHCRPTSRYAGSIVTFRPDGSDLRLDATRIRAPVGLAYAGTSDLFATLNQRGDLGAKTPGDWLAVVPAGSNWRFPECYGQTGSVCAGYRDRSCARPPRRSRLVVIVTVQLGASVGTAALVGEWNRRRWCGSG